MPEALAIDRELVKALVLQGLTNREVCAQTGVTDNLLRQWKCRHGWNKLLAQTKQKLEGITVTRLTKTVATEQGERVRHGIAEELANDLEVVKSKPAKSLTAVQNRQQVLSTMAGTAKTIFGWGETGSTVFNFNLLDSAKPAKAESEPIDVPSTPVQTTEQMPPDGTDKS